jgi:Flp pilus assembly protein TadD
VARQVGEAGARRRFERAIRALEALVTGKAKDGRVLVDLLIATDSLERNAP